MSKLPKKDFSIISIGTDFDGFTDTPQDLYLYEHFGKLLERMRSERFHCKETGRMVRRFEEETIKKNISPECFGYVSKRMEIIY